MAGSPSTTLFSPVLGTPELVSSLAGLGGAAWCTFLVSPGLRRDGLWCVWEGRRQVADGSRKKAGDGSFLSTERGKFLVGAQRARIKEPLFSVLGCRQLPTPPAAARAAHLSWHGCWYAVPGQGLPSPPGPKQQALSLRPPPTWESLTPSLSPAGQLQRHAHTAPFFSRALDGGGQASEQPQPGQQRLYGLLSRQPEHQGRSFSVGLGRRAGLVGSPILPFPSFGFAPPQGLWFVKNNGVCQT